MGIGTKYVFFTLIEKYGLAAYLIYPERLQEPKPHFKKQIIYRCARDKLFNRILHTVCTYIVYKIDRYKYMLSSDQIN